MAKIITHAPSKAYDEGWDAVFGKKEEEPEAVPHAGSTDAAQVHYEAKHESLSEEADKLGKVLPGGGVRKPRKPLKRPAE